jgi:hypothetical protein
MQTRDFPHHHLHYHNHHHHHHHYYHHHWLCYLGNTSNDCKILASISHFSNHLLIHSPIIFSSLIFHFFFLPAFLHLPIYILPLNSYLSSLSRFFFYLHKRRTWCCSQPCRFPSHANPRPLPACCPVPYVQWSPYSQRGTRGTGSARSPAFKKRTIKHLTTDNPVFPFDYNYQEKFYSFVYTNIFSTETSKCC